MIICVCGPTGIGKTRLSETLAEKFDAIVLNADATQIYKELDIGSAKITKEEMGDRKHFLFDIVSPNEEYSVSDYQNDARNILNKYKNKKIYIGTYSIIIFILASLLSKNNYILFNILKYYNYSNLFFFILIPLIAFTAFSMKSSRKA